MMLAACSVNEDNPSGNPPVPTESYETVLKYFKEINAVPRPSRHEEKMREYLREFAQARGLRLIEDNGNIIIYKNATTGMENAPMMCLQAHHGDVLHTCCCIFVDDDVAIVLNQSQASVLSKFPEVLAHLFLVAAGARHGIDLLEVVEHGLITLSRHRYIARGVIFVNRACSEHHQQCGCEKVIL